MVSFSGPSWPASADSRSGTLQIDNGDSGAIDAIDAGSNYLAQNVVKMLSVLVEFSAK